MNEKNQLNTISSMKIPMKYSTLAKDEYIYINIYVKR